MSNKSLLFIPDISGFTQFVNSTEVGHSQHVISELLEVLIDSNTLDLQLAEVEGDALFLYKEEEIPSQEQLLAQVENMFTAFHSHLKLLEKNRVCPCNACSTAPNLQLKIVVHAGLLQFITVQDKRKPFGQEVIEVHRLLKNDVNSDNYVLLSSEIVKLVELKDDYQSKLYNFKSGSNKYDGNKIEYQYSVIDNDKLKLRPFAQAKKMHYNKPPAIRFEKIFPVSAKQLLEYITNYSYRHYWTKGVDKIEFNEAEVTRLGSEHICVIDGKHLNFVTVTKKGEPGQLIYGEQTTSVPIADEINQFYIINPLDQNSCKLEIEMYWKAKSIFKKLILLTVGKRTISKNIGGALNDLHEFVVNETKAA